MTQVDKTDTKTIPLLKPNELPKAKKLSAKGLQARRVIKKHTAIASGIGFIPVPFISQLVLASHLAKLLNDLCKIYGVSFSDHQIKIIVTAVLGGAHAEWISRYLLKYMKGYTPALYSPGLLLLRPAMSAIIVHYIGQLFLGHLESGAWLRTIEKGLRQFG